MRFLYPSGSRRLASRGRGAAWLSNGKTSFGVDEPGRLLGRQLAGHFAADFMLKPPDRGTGIRTEHAIDLTIVIAKAQQSALHHSTVVLGHPGIVRKRHHRARGAGRDWGGRLGRRSLGG